MRTRLAGVSRDASRLEFARANAFFASVSGLFRGSVQRETTIVCTMGRAFIARLSPQKRVSVCVALFRPRNMMRLGPDEIEFGQFVQRTFDRPQTGTSQMANDVNSNLEGPRTSIVRNSEKREPRHADCRRPFPALFNQQCHLGFLNGDPAPAANQLNRRVHGHPCAARSTAMTSLK